MSDFRRYTNLAATIHLLKTKSITLLNPETWDDRNDAYFMRAFRRCKGAKTVLALCFAECPETYHHWRVFSHGSDGVCIAFNKEKLLGTFADTNGIIHGEVKYMTLSQLKAMEEVEPDKLPFLKRFGYTDEREYRVVYVDTEERVQYKDFPIRISWIDWIALSPWMSKALFNSVKETLQLIDGCASLSVRRSTLVDNDDWRALTERVHTEKRGSAKLRLRRPR